MYHKYINGRLVLAARKGASMVLEIIIMVIAVIFALGVIAENEKYNKRTYCYGFMACIIAVTILRGGLF